MRESSQDAPRYAPGGICVSRITRSLSWGLSSTPPGAPSAVPDWVAPRESASRDPPAVSAAGEASSGGGIRASPGVEDCSSPQCTWLSGRGMLSAAAAAAGEAQGGRPAGTLS